METIELNKEILLKEYKKADACGKKYLVKLYGKKTFIEPKKPLNLRDKLKTFDDVLKYNKTTLVKELPYKKPSNQRQKSLNASAIWLLIVETFNEGKVKDFNDSDQKMYVPYGLYDKENGGFSYYCYNDWSSYSNVGYGWGFLNYDDMIYCTKQFQKEWSNYLLGKV